MCIGVRNNLHVTGPIFPREAHEKVRGCASPTLCDGPISLCVGGSLVYVLHKIANVSNSI